MDKITVANEILLEDAASLMAEGRDVSITPLGTSMLPFIKGGKDTVTMRKLDSVEPGDIVLVRLPGRYVMHRVIKIDGDRLTLMGDGNVRGTETCRLDDVLGTVVKINDKKAGKGKLWRMLKPFRRYILAIYRRLI